MSKPEDNVDMIIEEEKQDYIEIENILKEYEEQKQEQIRKKNELKLADRKRMEQRKEKAEKQKKEEEAREREIMDLVPWLPAYARRTKYEVNKENEGKSSKYIKKAVNSEFIDVKFSTEIRNIYSEEQSKYSDNIIKKFNKLYNVDEISFSANFLGKKIVSGKDEALTELKMLIEYKKDKTDLEPIYYLLEIGRWKISLRQVKNYMNIDEDEFMRQIRLKVEKELPMPEFIPMPEMTKLPANYERLRIKKYRLVGTPLNPEDKNDIRAKWGKEEYYSYPDYIQKLIDARNADMEKLGPEIEEINKKNADIREQRKSVSEERRVRQQQLMKEKHESDQKVGEDILSDIRRLEKIKKELSDTSDKMKTEYEKKSNLIDPYNANYNEKKADEVISDLQKIGKDIKEKMKEIVNIDKRIEELRSSYTEAVKMADIKEVDVLPDTKTIEISVERYKENKEDKGRFIKPSKGDTMVLTERKKELLDKRREEIMQKEKMYSESNFTEKEVQTLTKLRGFKKYYELESIIQNPEKTEEDIKKIEQFKSLIKKDKDEEVLSVIKDWKANQEMLEKKYKLALEASKYNNRKTALIQSLDSFKKIDEESIRWMKENTALLIPIFLDAGKEVKSYYIIDNTLQIKKKGDPKEYVPKGGVYDKDAIKLEYNIKKGESFIMISIFITNETGNIRITGSDEIMPIFKEILEKGVIRQIIYSYSEYKK